MTKDHQPPTREDLDRCLMALALHLPSEVWEDVNRLVTAYADALEAERDHYRAEALRLGVLVKECDLQLRYLHEKFPTTGTTEQLLTKTAAIDEELAGLTRDQEDSK